MDKYSFYRLRSTRLPLLFEVCTSAGPVDAHEVQRSNSYTRVQVHSPSEEPIRGVGVICLTSQSMHLHFSHMSMFANNALLGGGVGVRVRIWIKDQRSKEIQRHY